MSLKKLIKDYQQQYSVEGKAPSLFRIVEMRRPTAAQTYKIYTGDKCCDPNHSTF